MLVGDDVPLDERRRDELIERFEVRHHPGTTGAVAATRTTRTSSTRSSPTRTRSCSGRRRASGRRTNVASSSATARQVAQGESVHVRNPHHAAALRWLRAAPAPQPPGHDPLGARKDVRPRTRRDGPDAADRRGCDGEWRCGRCRSRGAEQRAERGRTADATFAALTRKSASRRRQARPGSTADAVARALTRRNASTPPIAAPRPARPDSPAQPTVCARSRSGVDRPARRRARAARRRAASGRAARSPS